MFAHGDGSQASSRSTDRVADVLNVIVELAPKQVLEEVSKAACYQTQSRIGTARDQAQAVWLCSHERLPPNGHW